ncbi:MAG: ACT domain-containing protein [Ruminococcaceae bacterium]|nr:ACT domain-containing protein [Oscillospiraceae bacterium]
MKAVVTVTGKDTKGIIAKVSTLCSEFGANIVEITQSVLSEYFAMVMLVDINELTEDFGSFVDKMKALGKANCLIIDVMHEDIFNSMHRI